MNNMENMENNLVYNNENLNTMFTFIFIYIGFYIIAYFKLPITVSNVDFLDDDDVIIF